MFWIKVNLIRRFLRIGILKSIFINLRLLPFKQALKMPILVTRNTFFYDLSGKIVINCPVKFGLIRIGFIGEDTIAWKNERNLLAIKGQWSVNGSIWLGIGCILRIEKKGTLETGSDITFNFNNRIICYDHINIGNLLSASWEVQIFDSDLHYLKDIKTNEVFERNRPVILGNNIWIGNRTSILKGTRIPDFTTIASNSLCNKEYNIDRYTILAGTPAKVVKTNIYRPIAEENILEQDLN